jgi:acetylornithine deacetylase/succinyl-diaminopimelate desuccinylase-like protein
MFECAEMLRDHMEQIHIEARLLETESFPVVYGEVNNPSAQKTLLLLCHYDVVPVVFVN